MNHAMNHAKNLAINQDTVPEFCKVSELGTVTNGTWSPATVVEHRGYATLTCTGDELVQSYVYF